jgi:hypothetical protein
LGQHKNRAMLYDINGKFLTTEPIAEAERLVDFGDAIRLSRPQERPLRIRLLAARPTKPRAGSGCTFPASITESDMLAAVGITKGPGGVNRGRVNAARAKIEAFRASPRVRGVQELSVAAVTSAGDAVHLLRIEAPTAK